MMDYAEYGRRHKELMKRVDVLLASINEKLTKLKRLKYVERNRNK